MNIILKKIKQIIKYYQDMKQIQIYSKIKNKLFKFLNIYLQNFQINIHKNKLKEKTATKNYNNAVEPSQNVQNIKKANVFPNIELDVNE